MARDYPDDADGGALRGLASGGSDMSRPMEIDFTIAVPDERAARNVAAAVVKRGYAADVFFDDEDNAWTCTCTKTMLATYEGVVAAQRELADVCAPFGGTCDGWGSFGNHLPN
jgi:hypothetical protein